MIKQTMMFGSSVWVFTSVDNLNKVFRLQKRAARVILNADTRANSVDLFRELNWLTFLLEAKINQCALVYKRLNGVCPDYMLELLKRNIDIRSTERQSRYGSLNSTLFSYILYFYIIHILIVKSPSFNYFIVHNNCTEITKKHL